ncbi:MAG: hypothetical protein J7M38_12380 [Armatimonadetes bacterium]|nr:hypothetical protein [Armatimonadota bacterium]
MPALLRVRRQLPGLAWVAVAFICTVAAVVWALAAGDAAPPTPGFLAAAIETQEFAAGGKLELEGEVHRGDSDEVSAHLRYVRTADTIWVQRDCEGIWQNARQEVRKVANYDRVTQAYIELTCSAAGDPLTGLVGYGRYGIVADGSIPDIPLLHVSDVSLPEAIRLGVVSTAWEEVGGLDCLRVDLLADVRDGERRTAWLSPGVGFCPVRIRRERGDGRVDRYFENYQQIADGVWVPMLVRYVIRAPHPPPGVPDHGPVEWESRTVITRATVEPTLAGAELSVSLPEEFVLRRETPAGYYFYALPESD